MDRDDRREQWDVHRYVIGSALVSCPRGHRHKHKNPYFLSGNSFPVMFLYCVLIAFAISVLRLLAGGLVVLWALVKDSS